MAGGYLGNIYNSPINHSKSRNMSMDTGMMNNGMYSDADTFLNMETKWFDQKRARYMIVSALAIMLISSMTSNIDNKLVILLSIISFIISGLIAVGGVIYLIIAEALNNQRTPKTTLSPTKVDKFMNSEVGIIVGTSVGVFVLFVIIGIVSTMFMFRNLTGEEIVAITAINAFDRQNQAGIMIGSPRRFSSYPRRHHHHHRRY